MTALRAEAVNLMQNIPEEYLIKIIDYAKNFVKSKQKSAFGKLSKYADKNLFESEKSAWESEVTKNYGKNID